MTSTGKADTEEGGWAASVHQSMAARNIKLTAECDDLRARLAEVERERDEWKAHLAVANDTTAQAIDRAQSAEQTVKRLTEECERLKAAANAEFMARYPECACEQPLIRCDHRGCHCELCGLPERIEIPARAALVKENGDG